MVSKLLLPAFLALLATACINENEKADPLTPPEGPPDFSADTASAWFGLLLTALDIEDLNPPEASRRVGYAGVTLYEALVAGMPDNVSLGEQLNGLPEMPEVDEDDGDVHWPSAANAALADVLADLFATASAPTLQAITDLEAQLAADFAIDGDAGEIARGVAHGEAVAAEIIAWIADDGYTMWNDCAFTPPVGDGMWEPTPPGFTPNPLEPCWGNLRPFALLFAAECAPLPPLPFSRTPGSAFANEAQEVYDTGNALTPEQMDIATFWSDGDVTPPGHWVSIALQVIAEDESDLATAAEAFAKLGIALADSFIACWEIKYAFNLLRPITYIQDAAGPINDPAWTSFITTPPFPDFPSGHSAQSSAAAAVLTDVFGEVEFTDHTHDGTGLTARTYDSFEDAALEAAASRLLGGIHYRTAIERGVEQGACIANTILSEITFSD